MKSKRLLRFYYSADGLDEALDRLILNCALKSAEGEGSGAHYADRILKIIEAKDRLSELWNYLDFVINGLKIRDREVLRNYAAMRTGIKLLPEAEQRGVKRAVIKFTRHFRRVERFSEGIRLVNEYYCLF